MYGLDQSPPLQMSSYFRRAIAVTAVCALLIITAYLSINYNDQLHLIPPHHLLHDAAEQLDTPSLPIQAAANATLGVGSSRAIFELY